MSVSFEVTFSIKGQFYEIPNEEFFGFVFEDQLNQIFFKEILCTNLHMLCEQIIYLIHFNVHPLPFIYTDPNIVILMFLTKQS